MRNLSATCNTELQRIAICLAAHVSAFQSPVIDCKSTVRRSETAVSSLEIHVTEPKVIVNDAKSVVSLFKFTVNPVEESARWIKSRVSELAEHVIRIQFAVTELEETVISPQTTPNTSFKTTIERCKLQGFGNSILTQNTPLQPEPPPPAASTASCSNPHESGFLAGIAL